MDKKIYKVISKQVEYNNKKFFVHQIINPKSRRKIDFRLTMECENANLLNSAGAKYIVLGEDDYNYTEAFEFPRVYCTKITRLATDEDFNNPELEANEDF